MINFSSEKKCLVLGLMIALLTGILLFCWELTAQAADRGGRYNTRGEAFRTSPRHSPQAVQGGRHREFRDTRYSHNRSYPVHGRAFRTLPSHSHRVSHGGRRYYFSGGVWYRPYGPYYSVVFPPIGLFAPVLPPYYTTVWLGGAPYYYANEVYYAHRGAGYVVVPPPKEDVSEAPPPADELFVYPRLGQSEKQKADDRYGWHRWAVSQTGFDPTQPPDAQQRGSRVDYQRAQATCLEGRGYTVR